MVCNKGSTTYSILGETVRISIVTAILNSPEIVRRQILHYEKMSLPDDIEIIYVDDGSVPPLSNVRPLNFDFKLYYTNDSREWTQPAARNFGVKQASGEFVIVTDIDHILSRELIDTVYEGQWDVVRFKREFGVLNVWGGFTQNVDTLVAYGLPIERIKTRGLKVTPHTNSFAMRRDLYWQIGGVSEKHVGSGKHPNREEQPVKAAYKRLAREGKITVCGDEDRPTIYMIPNGRYCGDKDYNPFGLFHNLERMTR